MKKFLFSLAFVCALAVSSFGQSASDITVSGTLYNGFNDPCTSCTFTVTVTRRDGVAVSTAPRTVTSHASTGAVSFTLPRKSFVTFQGQFTVGRYNWRNGISMFLPDQSTIDIVDIQSVEDAAAALVAVSAAPSDAQYVVGTANGTLSAEQSLGALTTGLLKNTVSGSTGTLSTAVAGTDYVAPGGALGTPSSGTLTNATGLPPTTGIVGWPANSAGVLTNNGSGTLTWAAGGGAGTVTSVAQSFTGGLISVGGSPVTTSGTLALTVAGTSGGIPYFDSASSWASSGVLAANALVIGGGAGVAPSTITTGTGVVTALGVNVGGAGAFVVNGGALGTPSSGTLTNATGLPVATGISGLGTGVATALGVNTGSAGAFVVLGGALGTPSSGTATNLTGLPISTGVSGLGTGIATALGVNVGSAGAPVLFDGAGGTPSSINLTNGTALPLSTGVSGDLPFANFVQAGSAGFVGATGAGDYSHRTPTQVTAALDNFVGDSGSGGTKGLVPAPSAGDAAANKYLKADGTWATVSAGGGITVGTTTVTSGTATRLFYETAGNVVGQISGATSDGTTVTLTSPTVNTGITLNAAPLTMSGNISASAWTTNGIRIKGVAATLTDTTSSGTVAAAYTNVLGGNTIAASSSTTFTDYFTTFMTQPTAGSNVTFTNRWALGLSGAMQGSVNAIGTTSTDGIVLQNTTAAAAGAQQYSPRLRFKGSGWKTNATAAAQDTEWIIEARPVQGAANPTVNLAILAQVNAGGYTAAVAPGQILAPGGGSSSQSAPQYSAVNNTNYGLRIGGGNAGNAVAIVAGSPYLVVDGNTNAIAIPTSSSLRWGAANIGSQQVALYSPANDVLQIRDRNVSTVGGNLILGGSGSSLPTSATATLVLQNGTAPGSSPADQFSLYSADSAAGDANAFIRNEAGEINRISGLAARNSSSFAKTSDTTLANITGLSRNVEAGRAYAFTATLQTTAAATGGVKFAVSGTATATSISYEGVLVDSGAIVNQTRATALDTVVCASTTSTAGTCTVKGVIVVNGAGTLTLQFAQNASDGGASTVLVNQFMQLVPIS